MKIQGALPVHKVDPAQGGVREAGTKRSPEEEQVVLSDTARFIQSLRETVVNHPEDREELIALTRAEIDAGSFGSDADYDRAVDSLLTEV
ncbi:MAG: flagellar biosynthesis anti-sigma factor FlgM [Myxococcota bacterium]|nr:flagellar biosynthesis anti-sigma factor FlgM [Myxococcota bacterium]